MDMIKKPKIWLVVLALMHTFMGVIGSYVQMGGDTEHLAVILYFLPVAVYLLYAAFMTEGQEQARLAAVLCGPVFVWFVICAAMGLDMAGEPAAPFPQAILPMILWGMPALCGVMNWNSELAEESTETTESA